MRKAQWILGVLVGVLMIASSAAHTFIGWKVLSLELAKTTTPAAVVSALQNGWRLGGMAQLVFGLLVLWTFAALLRGRSVPLAPARLIAAGYFLFGIFAYLS